MALEISHLVVNGCSFTYCQGLYDPPTEGWPRLLADKLGVPVVNLAAPGSSNDGIHRRTYDYFYKNLSNHSKPFYIMAMSQNTRREEYVIYRDHKMLRDYTNISSNDRETLSKEIFKNMDDKGIALMEFQKLMKWRSLINLFEAHNVPFFTSDYFPNFTEGTFVQDYIKKNYLALYMSIHTHPNTLKCFTQITRPYPKALDNGHDGKEAQVVLADYIYNQIIKRYKEIKPVDSEFLSLKNFKTQNFPQFEDQNRWYRYEMGLPRKYGLDE